LVLAPAAARGLLRRRPCDLLVVDEASMGDVMLTQALVKAIPDDAALLIVDHIDQLPSVGPGQVLDDIIGSGRTGRTLDRVFRRDSASRIIINAHRINQGAMPDLGTPIGDSDFYFVAAEDPETKVLRIVHRHHARQAARGSRGLKEGRRDRAEKPLGAATVVEAR
jgi:ATP-dependent exoDNAse (exonuclease V) alpha subunit